MESVNAVHALYAAAIVALAVAAHLIPALDLRGVGRVGRRRLRSAPDEAEFTPAPARRSRPDAVFVIPRADVTVIVAFAGVAGVALAAGLGFLGPKALVAAFQGTPFSLWPIGAPEAIGRAAQVIGAVCGLLIGLRMIRAFMALAVLALAGYAAREAALFVAGPLSG